MIELREVKSRNDLKTFVKFPFTLYKDSKYWVPPVIKQEMNTFNEDLNPIFDNAEATLFLAYRDNQIVGRIAAIINWLEVKTKGQKRMRFGWFDSIDDIEVTKALLDKVREIGKHHDLDFIEGPMGFSNLDKVGILTEGFDHIGSMVTWYNYPYYADHLLDLGFTPEKEYIESKFDLKPVDPTPFIKAQALIKKRYHLRPLSFTKTKDVIPYTDKMFDLFNTSYASLSSFVEITDAQKEYFKKKFIKFIDPEYIKFILDKDDNMVAFAIVMPSFSEALQEINGKLFPFGFLKILKAKKQSKKALFYLIGVLPEYHNKGVTAIIFDEFYREFMAKGVETCIRTPELADNLAVQKIWRHFNPVIYKRRKTFKKAL